MATPKQKIPGITNKPTHPLEKFSSTAKILVAFELPNLELQDLAIAEFKKAIRRVVDRIHIAQDEMTLEQCQKRFAGLQKQFESIEKISNEEERSFGFDNIRKKIEEINVERRDALAHMSDVYENFMSSVASALEVAEHPITTGSEDVKSKYIGILTREYNQGTKKSIMAASELGDVTARLGAERPAVKPVKPRKRQAPEATPAEAKPAKKVKPAKPESGK